MTKQNKNSFCPDYAVHPAEIALEILEAKGISPAPWVSRLLREIRVNENIAEILEDVTGIKSNIYLNLQKSYGQLGKE